jgi:hypothetical protein
MLPPPDWLFAVVAFSHRRLVGALVDGDFYGMEVDQAANGAAILFDLDYQDIAEISLRMKRGALRGSRPKGVTIVVRRPYRAGLSIDVGGTTTLDLQGDRRPDIAAHFGRIARAIADWSLSRVAPSEREAVQAFLTTGISVDEDGDPVAVFESDDDDAASVGRTMTEQHPARQPEEPAGDLCSSCSAALESEMKFCGKCGTRRPQPNRSARFCGHCGAENEAGARFCGSCGRSLDPDSGSR